MKRIFVFLTMIACVTPCLGLQDVPQNSCHTKELPKEIVMPSKEDPFFAEQELVPLRRVIFKQPIPAPEHTLVLDMQQVGFTSFGASSRKV